MLYDPDCLAREVGKRSWCSIAVQEAPFLYGGCAFPSNGTGDAVSNQAWHESHTRRSVAAPTGPISRARLPIRRFLLDPRLGLVGPALTDRLNHAV